MAIRFVIKQNGSDTGGANKPPISEYIFDENLFTIGSDAANHLILAESAAEQAVVVRENEFLTLINRAEGTSLNGKILRREAFQPLEHGDHIEIGTYVISVLDSRRDAPENVLSAFEEKSSKAEEFLPIAEKSEEKADFPAEDTITASSDTDAKKPVRTRNFAAVLDTLRTEEDSFYFIVEDKAGNQTRRIPLEKSEMPLGAGQRGEIASKAEEISISFGIARKDWSGILLEAIKPNLIFVNGETIADARRLRNDDRISFPASIKETLVLHEPSSLVALESLLTTRDSPEARFGIHKTSSAETESLIVARTKEKKNPLFERTFFGYFSFLEIVTMFLTTLIGAVLFFLFFEFMFS